MATAQLRSDLGGPTDRSEQRDHGAVTLGGHDLTRVAESFDDQHDRTAKGALT
jgi:hypothetical protein